ncbi:inositol-pentakisphosphate 2-kinase-like [Argentina anserina]|uniref:inositol-pentakisphosphate 2-kinase-like n=1 Tax=Argentina anserina TaxID=57926 RepID=UPI0021762730|nr:inositol-pentakisphosphate 2-kinase-like [Potentilla anserina]
MEVILEKKDADDWVYRGEGAANLVLAYSGSSPDFIGKVMRIQKAERNGSKRSSSPTALTMHERLLWKDLEDVVSSSNKELASQLYVKHVMSPLLGTKFVDSGMHVPATRELLETVEKNVNFQRPASRVDAAKVDTECDYVLLMSDHSIFPSGIQEGETCISVEIKPKCGFLPSSEYIDEGDAIKRRITRFRMHQALKLHDGKVSEYSDYDPLDLFSGSKDRIHKAIKDLFATPQNNLRVFVNGSLIFGGLGGGAESTDSVIEDKFETALEGVIQGGDGSRTVNFLQLIAEIVHKSGVMDQLLEIQKLDNLDIDGAIHAYYDIISEPCMVCTELGRDKASNRYSALHSLPLDEKLKIVKDFLIAATAKDCSLMFSFRPRKDGSIGSLYNNVYLESTNQYYDYKVHFIDLDLKSLKNLETYYELDKKIVSCYNEMMNTKERLKLQVQRLVKVRTEISYSAMEDALLEKLHVRCFLNGV